MRIGVLDLSVAGWTAGGIFTRVVSHGLAQAALEEPDVQLTFITSHPAHHSLEKNFQVEKPVTWEPLNWAERIQRRLGTYQPPNWLELTAHRRKLDVIVPIVYAACAKPTRPTRSRSIGWIPDFQHLYLPEFFEKDEIQRRETQCALCVETSTKMLFSSEDSLQHFKTRFPGQAKKGKAIPFPSIFAFEPPPDPVGDIRKKFHLPSSYILVANQFWAHKNHLVVIRALAALKSRGINQTVVFTGQLGDHRNGEGCILSRVMQEAATLGVYDRIRVLGLVSRPDLVELMRSAAAVLQPSRWEGWSTTVQDAKAIGRPVICSDLAVHREQAPEAMFFFTPTDADDLANKLETADQQLAPGPDLAGEEVALARERTFARDYGQEFLRFCRSAFRETIN